LGNGPFGPLVLISRKIVFFIVHEFRERGGGIEGDRIIAGGVRAPAQQGGLTGLIDPHHKVMIFIDDCLGGSGNGAVFSLGVKTIGEPGDNDNQRQGEGRG